MGRRAQFSLKQPAERTHIAVPNATLASLIRAGEAMGLGKIDPKTQKFVGAPLYTVIDALIQRYIR